MRFATFTVSPMTENSRRWLVPMLPTTAGPAWMPMRWASGGSPRAARTALRLARAAIMPRAARTARSAASGIATGVPKVAMIPSPMNLSRVPPASKIAATMRSWYSDSSCSDWVGVSPAQVRVKPARSLNSTTTSCSRPPAWRKAALPSRMPAAMSGEK